jgi:hypothetical protein
MGCQRLIDEHPARVPYLDALQILLDSDGLLLVGSEEAHYTASKVFPYILAEKPLLAIVNKSSSVVRILGESNVGHTITFNIDEPVATKIPEIASQIEQILATPDLHKPPTNWKALDRYSARMMAQRLAMALDSSLISLGPQTSQQDSVKNRSSLVAE